MRQLSTCTILAIIVIQVVSQTIYIDYDTGKVLGVEEAKQNPQYPEHNQQYPHRNHHQRNYPQGNWRPHHQQHMPNGNYPQWTPNRNQIQGTNNPKPQWVCVNSVTGQSMIIDTTTSAAKPGPNSQMQNPGVENPYQDNPWLNNQKNPLPNNQIQPTISPTNFPVNNGNNNEAHQEQTTRAPVTVPPPTTTETPEPTKAPFPTLPEIDWSQFLPSSTEKPTANLNAAIDGEGVFEPRIFE